MEVKEIAKLILTHTTTIDELNYLGRVLKHQHNNLQQYTAAEFSVGQKVYFDSKKYNMKVEGVITKINTKTISMKTINGGSWKVSPSLLKVA